MDSTGNKKFRRIDDHSACWNNRVAHRKQKVPMTMVDYVALLIRVCGSSLQEDILLVALLPEHARYSITAVYNPHQRTTELFEMYGQPFGAGHSVPNFCRVAEWLCRCIRRLFHLCLDHFFDDYFLAEPSGTAAIAVHCFQEAFSILGFTWGVVVPVPSARQYQTHANSKVTQDIAVSLRLMRVFLSSTPPREVPLSVSTPVIVYTDASDVPDRNPQHMLGAVLWDPADHLLFYSASKVPTEVIANWLPKKSLMGQLELLAAPFALTTWRRRLTGRPIIMFIDNDGAASNLVKGYSNKLDSAAIVGHFWLEASQCRALIYIDRVESKSNLSDGPSRLDFSLLLRECLLTTRPNRLFAWGRVTAVSAKLESIMGRHDVRRTRSRPLTSRQPQSLGEKLMDLTERLGHLDDLLDDFQRHSFQPPLRRPPSVVPPAPQPAPQAAQAVPVAPVAQATPRGETQLVEASVKAVARSLLDAARHRSPSASVSYHSQFTPVQLVRQPSSSRSTTPAAVARVRSPGPGSLGSTSVGLTPPPGLFVPSGFATPLTPALTPAAPLAPAFNGPLTVMPQFTFESLAQNLGEERQPALERHPTPHRGFAQVEEQFGRAHRPTGPRAQQCRDENPQMARHHPHRRLGGNGSERGWDDAQIRQIASFANKNHLSHLPPEQLYQRYVENQVANPSDVVLMQALRPMQETGRRALYERLRASAAAADPHEVFQFFAATLHVLLAMGFPLHRCSLPLAAWVGSVELLQVLSRGCKDCRPGGVPGGGTIQMLMSWAARGVYANPCTEGQVQVLKWLMAHKGDPNQRDSAGRSVLDWACWAGCEELASLLLRRRPPPSSSGRSVVASCPPLLLATASRSTRLVKLLLDATGDPHATPTSSESGHGCGALMLAVRCCEFELASQVPKAMESVRSPQIARSGAVKTFGEYQ
eukprot:s603_g32.t1